MSRFFPPKMNGAASILQNGKDNARYIPQPAWVDKAL